MKRAGIVGHEGAKFTPHAEAEARRIIREILADADVCVSGACHLGGVDVWAEEIAKEMGREGLIFPPRTRSWEAGYKPRNLKIAEASDVVHVLVVATYPPGWQGMTFPLCYHCGTRDHIKSGACWTAKQAQRMGKGAQWHIIAQDGGR